MAREILLDEECGEMLSEGERVPLGNLEERIGHLLIKYEELKKEREELALALDREREKTIQLEKRLGLLSQDREKVKTRIDQLLLRLKGIDF